ncbi:MAG: zinc metalloprotease HtpX [Actinomycetales bacterium]|nr:zinc metalloprotease HtpX [Actinomycetales bacterium]
MRKTRYGTDRGLTARMFGTMFGLGLLYVILAAALYAIGFNAVFVLAISGALLFGQWWFSDSLAMSSMRAKIVTPEQAPQLHAIVDRVCAMADMPKPRVGIANSDVPNAFATGRSQSRAVVVVTTGLLRRLDPEELEGVLAHELSHVAHRDVTVMTIASFTAILAGFMTRSVMWSSMGRNRDQNTAVVFLVVTLVSVVVYFLSYLLIRALSRYRELGADRGAALLTGRPSALARALQKISGDMGQIPTRDLRQMEPVSAFAFAPAMAPGRRGLDLGSLMSTHPTLERRLEQLAKISAELGER